MNDDECGSRGENSCDPGRRENGDRQTYAIACRSRGRALRPKNNAWLATAETTASWNGLAIRKAGSGRCPVRKRSGIGGDEDDRHFEGGQHLVDGVEARTAVGQLDIGQDEAGRF